MLAISNTSIAIGGAWPCTTIARAITDRGEFGRAALANRHTGGRTVQTVPTRVTPSTAREAGAEGAVVAGDTGVHSVETGASQGTVTTVVART